MANILYWFFWSVKHFKNNPDALRKANKKEKPLKKSLKYNLGIPCQIRHIKRTYVICMTLQPCLSLPTQLSLKFQLAVLSYFSLLNFITLSVQIIVLHFNFIVDKRELKNTCSVDITAICILITWTSSKVMQHCSREKREKVQIPHTIEMKFRLPVYVPLCLVELCRTVLFTTKQVVLY